MRMKTAPTLTVTVAALSKPSAWLPPASLASLAIHQQEGHLAWSLWLSSGRPGTEGKGTFLGYRCHVLGHSPSCSWASPGPTGEHQAGSGR